MSTEKVTQLLNTTRCAGFAAGLKNVFNDDVMVYVRTPKWSHPFCSYSGSPLIGIILLPLPPLVNTRIQIGQQFLSFSRWQVTQWIWQWNRRRMVGRNWAWLHVHARMMNWNQVDCYCRVGMGRRLGDIFGMKPSSYVHQIETSACY